MIQSSESCYFSYSPSCKSQGITWDARSWMEIISEPNLWLHRKAGNTIPNSSKKKKKANKQSWSVLIFKISLFLDSIIFSETWVKCFECQSWWGRWGVSQCSAAHIHCNQIMSYRQACLKATIHSACSLTVFLVCCQCILFYFSVIFCLISKKGVVEGVESRRVAPRHSRSWN